MYKETSRSVSQIRQFISERGDEYLDHFGEVPISGAQWLHSSHGSVIRVQGEYEDIFERLFVVVPRPREAPAERFQKWVGERLQGLAWYMEVSNTGKCVRQNVSEHAACAIVMRRIGALLGSASCPIPAADEALPILEGFVRDVRSYVRNIGDDALRYVRSLRLFKIPRKTKGFEYVIGLDILPTLVGLEGESVPIHPLTLVRSTIGELAELLDGQLGERDLGRLSRRQRASIKDVVKHLDAICIEIDRERPDLEAVQQLLKATRQGNLKHKSSGMSSWMGAIIIVVGLYLFWRQLDA